MKVNRRELLKNAAFVSGASLVGAWWPPEQEIVGARWVSGFTQSPQPGELGNRTHRRGDDGKPEFRPFSRMAAECRWQASRLDVSGQRWRESRDSFALR